MNTETNNTCESAAPVPDVRKQIIDFLRRELVGPDPVAHAMQANGEEVLVSDPPRLRYGAGVLFPQALPANSAIETMPDEVSDSPDDVLDEETAPDTDPAERPVRPVQMGGIDDPDGLKDEMVSLSNAFLPSAMGFSCLVEVPTGGLVAEITAATYAPRDVMQVGKDGKPYKRRHYDRKPFASRVELRAEALLGKGVQSGNFTVTRDGSPEKLCVRVLSRPVQDEGPAFRLLTLALVNTQNTDGRAENEKCFFQVEMKLCAADGAAVFREYPDVMLQYDEEECSLALLYRHRKTYGIGHGCAAAWNEVDNAKGRADAVWCDVLPVHEIKPIVPRVFPELPLKMLDLSDRRDESNLEPVLKGLCDSYAKWIGEQEAIASDLDIEEGLQKAAARHLQKCRECLARMRGGVQLLRNDETVRKAFRLANRAMLQQQLHYALGTDARLSRSWKLQEWGSPQIDPAPAEWTDIENPPARKGTWYPFQLAFVLMNLRSLACEQDDERKIVDLIWFPTGGGKTEAYLGLTAFTIILRRLRHPDDAGTSVLMRYTLRLLTAQQFQRAASLICALEKMRRAGELPGKAMISIGLWAGSGLTPNDRADAKKELQKLENGEVRENPFVMLSCPWCGARMGRVEDGARSRVLGYETDRAAHLPGASTVVFRCADSSCDFGGNSLLPLTVIDEDLYACPPTLLLGTVDKFAMLPWKPDARAFFGLKHEYLPPDLIIQDELHLISGPLGSMVGHYETVINELCMRRDEDDACIGPKIVASTATISRAAEQCHGLWNCGKENVFQFPPQLLKAGDSFFAEEYKEEPGKPPKPGRVYIGVHASALGSHVTSQVRVMAALLQAPLVTQVAAEKERDPYWTLIGYYNSLRELGHAATLLRADITEYLNAMRLRLGIWKPEKEGEFDRRRFIYRDLELTSRIPSGQIPEALQQLFVTYPASRDERPVDVALATTMISVGVDVPRLGLMTVAGQPKTTSEYIQATSRVGREKPGLVVTIYNTGKPRDRSHYEHFHSYHGAVYRAVEPTSVTPFSSPVRDRALHALLTTLVRYRGTPANLDRPAPMPDSELLKQIESIIDERVQGVDPSERAATKQQLREKIDRWSRVAPPRYGGWGPLSEEIPLLYPAGLVPSPQWNNKSWPTPSSMRDVDASCEADVIGEYPQPPVEEQDEAGEASV